MDNNIVNIAMITDDNYVKPTVVTLTSILCNKKPDTDYNIFILTSNLTKSNINLLKQLNSSSFHISIIDKSRIVEKYCNLNQERHVTCTAVLKFFLPEIFNNLEKILYLDSDILVQSDLSVLFNIDLENYYAAVVKDTLSKVDKTHMIKHNILNQYYFNTGVMLLNLSLMRKDEISQSLLSFRLNQKNHFMDQDAFNAIIGNNVKFISYKYNFLNCYFDKLTIKELSEFYNEKFESTQNQVYQNCHIIHLGGAYKPWKFYMGYLTKLYMEYKNKSPLSEEKIVLKRIRKNNSFLQRIFSLRNNNAHKVITIMFFKIKIKRGI